MPNHKAKKNHPNHIHIKGRRGNAPLYASPDLLKDKVDQYLAKMAQPQLQYTRNKNGMIEQTEGPDAPSLEGLALFCGFMGVRYMDDLAIRKPKFKQAVEYAKEGVRDAYQKMCDNGLIPPLIGKTKLQYLGIKDNLKVDISATLTVNWKRESDKALNQSRAAISRVLKREKKDK